MGYLYLFFNPRTARVIAVGEPFPDDHHLLRPCWTAQADRRGCHHRDEFRAQKAT